MCRTHFRWKLGREPKTGRVTVLGELGDSLGRFVKITEAAHIFGLLFPWLRLHINLDKNGSGHILGEFFTNSYGHSA
jgi:hypothetical protein